MELPFGIDISKHNHSADGNTHPNYEIINSVCDFVAVRAGMSWGYVDPQFHGSWQRLSLPRIAYHVIFPGEDATRQTDHLLSIINPGENDRIALDMELDDGYSKGRITDTLLKCLENVLAETGRYPIVYSRASWVNQFLDVSRLPVLDWWLAHYLARRPAPLYTPEKSPPPALPKGVNSWLIHQTGERGNGRALGVVSHYVDTDRFNGTLDELRAYFGLGEETPPEPEPPTDGRLFDARVFSWAKPYINFRSEPRISPETDIGNIETDVTVPVYEVIGNWYKISYENTDGYVMSKYLEPLSDYTPPPIVINIQPLWQKDPRWGSIKLGNSYLTLATDGCLVTDFAMVIGVTPAEFNARMKAVGGFTGARIYWGMIEEAYPDCKYVWAYDCYYIPAPLDKIDEFLGQGIPVMVHVTRNGYQHWVLIVGKDGNDYTINDPIDGHKVSFRERYGDPAKQILRVRVYRK